MQNLLRFDAANPQRELLEVLAAGVRHTQPLAIDLDWQRQSLTLSVFPSHRLVFCPIVMADFLAGPLKSLQVRQVQPATLRPPGSADAARIGNPAIYAPLEPLLWAVALRGARDAPAQHADPAIGPDGQPQPPGSHQRGLNGLRQITRSAGWIGHTG